MPKFSKITIQIWHGTHVHGPQIRLAPISVRWRSLSIGITSGSQDRTVRTFGLLDTSISSGYETNHSLIWSIRSFNNTAITKKHPLWHVLVQQWGVPSSQFLHMENDEKMWVKPLDGISCLGKHSVFCCLVLWPSDQFVDSCLDWIMDLGIYLGNLM